MLFRSPESDTGLRSIYLWYTLREAVEMAIATAGQTHLAKGWELGVKVTGTKPNPKGREPIKEYVAIYRPASGAVQSPMPSMPEPGAPAPVPGVPPAGQPTAQYAQQQMANPAFQQQFAAPVQAQPQQFAQPQWAPPQGQAPVSGGQQTEQPPF